MNCRAPLPAAPRRQRRNRPRGLTLVEMVVVLLILAITTAIAVGSLEGPQNQARFDASKRTLEELRAAILGPDAVDESGRLSSGGYLQDVGWLPAAAADIASNLPPAGVAPRGYSTLWQTWCGWAGPYLRQPLRQGDATGTAYDGFGRDFYGWPGGTPWTVPLLSGNFSPRSMAADGVMDADGGGTSPYDADWPTSTQPLVTASDWVVDVREWQVRIVNRTATPVALPAVRLKIVVPRWEHYDGSALDSALSFWPPDVAARNAWEQYGSAAMALNLAASGNPGDETAVQIGSTDPAFPRRVPLGRRILILVDETTGLPTTPRAASELRLSRRVAPYTVDLELR